MENKNRLDLYEKLYFHEIDVRERLNTRLQTPMALIISLIGALAFMLQNYRCQEFSHVAIAFLLLFSLSGVFLTVAIYCFIRSWYNNVYRFLPCARDTENYHQQLVDTYRPYDKSGKLAEHYFEEYISKYYIDCSSANTKRNDSRSLYAHKTNTFLIITAIFAFSTFFTFHLGGLEKDHVREPIEINLIAPAQIKGSDMNTKPPSELPQNSSVLPNPPSPPPPREIREGVEVVKPYPPAKDKNND